MGVDNHAVVGAFTTTQGLRARLFELIRGVEVHNHRSPVCKGNSARDSSGGDALLRNDLHRGGRPGPNSLYVHIQRSN